jgi:hypothetical protein
MWYGNRIRNQLQYNQIKQETHTLSMRVNTNRTDVHIPLMYTNKTPLVSSNYSCFAYLYLNTWSGIQHDFYITWYFMSLNTNRVADIKQHENSLNIPKLQWERVRRRDDTVNWVIRTTQTHAYTLRCPRKISRNYCEYLLL